MTRLLLTLLLTVPLSISQASELYFVDAHSQADDEVELALILERMGHYKVRKTILAARNRRTPFEIADFADASGGRIIAALRTKSGAFTRNPAKHDRKIKQQHRSGRFSAMAEVLLYHAQKGDKAEEVSILPDDTRVQDLLRIARQEKWPFVIHIEFASLHGGKREQFMHSMQQMLRDNIDHPFVLNHMGQLQLKEVRNLIQSHPNLSFLLAHTNPYIIHRSNQPWTNIFKGKTLAPAWKSLLVEYPERFIFALDNVWARHWEKYYGGQMDYWHSAMADLPEDVAHTIAHGNAERLWQLD